MSISACSLLYTFFFFFKQKTAYEIGLGIPAEPLFRSYGSCDPRQQEPYDQYHENSHAKHWDYHKTPLRSEERFSRNAETDLVCRLLLERKQCPDHLMLNSKTHELIGHAAKRIPLEKQLHRPR